MSTLKLSNLADTLIASEIVRLGASIKEKIKAGEKIYNYTIGDFDSSDFPIPQVLEDAIITAYQEKYTTYPAAEGELALRKAVGNFIEKYQSITYSPNEILISAGGRPLIYSIYRALIDRGDKIIYPVPSWNNNHYVHFTEGNHVIIEATEENKFMPTADQIAPHLKGATLLALCSPLNPTGTTFSEEQLGAICDLILAENKTRADGEKKLYLMYDQIYWTLTFGETTHVNPVAIRPEMRDYTLFVDGISKSFAATGVRVGWALGPAEVIIKMRAINSHIGTWAPMAEQVAVSKFLSDDEAVSSFLNAFKEEIYLRLTGFYDGIQKLKERGYKVNAIAPQAAIYLTVQFDLTGKKTAEGKELKTQEDITQYILDEAKLAIVPFKAFGAGNAIGWYRLSVGCCHKQDIPGVLGNLEAAMKKLS